MTTLYIVRTTFRKRSLYVSKAIELKDDIVHSKDDFYKLNLCSMEDAESKDDIAI